MISHGDIVACARGWLGTRFHHQGRLKKSSHHKGGVDCLGLLVGVAGELHLQNTAGQPLYKLDEVDYAHYPDVTYLKAKLASALMPIALSEMQPGEIALMSVDNQPQHLGIISDRGQGYGIIHAYAPARAVVEHELDAYWHKRIIQLYRFI